MIKPLTTQGKAFFAAVNRVAVALYRGVFAAAGMFPAVPLSCSYLGLFVMTLAMGIISVKIPGLNSLISLADTFVFAAVLFYGPLPAALLAGTDGFVSTRKH